MARRPYDPNSIHFENICAWGLVHGHIGMVDWPCYNQLFHDNKILGLIDGTTDEPITCMRCMVVKLRGHL